MTEPALHVHDDPAVPVAELLAAEAAHGGTIVLTGGSTPARAYELAARDEPDWSRASVWWGDERCVPPDDERSNYGLALRTLFHHLLEAPFIHRIRGEIAPGEAAAEYDRALDGVTLDLLLLGLGPDGHGPSPAHLPPHPPGQGGTGASPASALGGHLPPGQHGGGVVVNLDDDDNFERF